MVLYIFYHVYFKKSIYTFFWSGWWMIFTGCFIFKQAGRCWSKRALFCMCVILVVRYKKIYKIVFFPFVSMVGDGGDGFLRITFFTTNQKWHKEIKRLKALVICIRTIHFQFHIFGVLITKCYNAIVRSTISHRTS